MVNLTTFSTKGKETLQLRTRGGDGESSGGESSGASDVGPRGGVGGGDPLSLIHISEPTRPY